MIQKTKRIFFNEKKSRNYIEKQETMGSYELDQEIQATSHKAIKFNGHSCIELDRNFLFT